MGRWMSATDHQVRKKRCTFKQLEETFSSKALLPMGEFYHLIPPRKAIYQGSSNWEFLWTDCRMISFIQVINEPARENVLLVLLLMNIEEDGWQPWLQWQWMMKLKILKAKNASTRLKYTLWGWMYTCSGHLALECSKSTTNIFVLFIY